jgi:hypothetical protein
MDDLLYRATTSETAHDFVLIRFYSKTTKVLYAGQVEEQKACTSEVKFMGRHGETSQFSCFDTDNMSEIDREDIVAKLPQPISSGGTARTITLKYCSANFLKK